MRGGRVMEFFAEGGRSRHGAVAELKLGLIGMLIECVWRRQVKDVVVVPVGLDYDRVPEASSYAAQLLGKPKVGVTAWCLSVLDCTCLCVIRHLFVVA